ncbi:MAG: hypothetical protein HOH82_21985 [Planctomycetaceae bacterium]|jgi:hypothetical protein|nr:hypothetical protein [Planctomycetaceae bacterium]
MAGSIKTCPACRTLLLRDTVQCPECNHVLDKEAHGKQETASEQAAPESSSVQDICPTCEEGVRRGMVRCWNCGSFMREDIGELYMKMQAKPAPVIYSASPGGEDVYTVEDPGDAVLTGETQPRAEDDFELSAEITARASSSQDAGTYSLNEEPTKEDSADESKPEAAPEAESKPESAPPAADSDSAEVTGKNTDSAASSDESESQEEKKPEDKGKPEDPTESHSVATGGDALLQIALEEELETGKRRRQPKKKQAKGRAITGFLVFCANGHRIEVQNRHRGKAGRCPRCKSLFIVPEKTSDTDGKSGDGQAADAAASADGTDQTQSSGRYSHWMKDVHLHTVNPEKLRLKPGSLEKDFQTVDVGFAKEDILAATLPAAKGLFGMSGGGKNDEAREALLTSLREETPIDDIPVAEKRVLTAESLQQLAIDQPVIYEHESMFVGIPVFGEGRIAVRLPKAEAKDLPTFLSFDLSAFREFSKHLGLLYGIEEFGVTHEVPLAEEFTEQTCHYSEQKFRSIENAEFYQADSASTVKLVGRKCEACGLVISEDSRKKEKIGGANGRGIAKANCPKCKKKFGDISLFDLEDKPEPTPEEQTDQPEATAAAEPAK